MSILKNILTLIGLLALIAAVAAYLLLKPVISEFDPEFVSTYEQFAGKLIETGDPGEAMMWSVPEPRASSDGWD